MTEPAVDPIKLTTPELEYLAGQRIGRIATASDKGLVDVAPVGF